MDGAALSPAAIRAAVCGPIACGDTARGAGYRLRRYARALRLRRDPAHYAAFAQVPQDVGRNHTAVQAENDSITSIYCNNYHA